MRSRSFEAAPCLQLGRCDSNSFDYEKLVLIERGNSDSLDLAVLRDGEALTGANGGDFVDRTVERERDDDVMDGNDVLHGPSHFAGGIDQMKQPPGTIVLRAQDDFDGAGRVGDGDRRTQVGLEKVEMGGQVKGLNRIAKVAREVDGFAFTE